MKKIYPMKRIAAGCMALCIAFAAFGFSDGSVSDIALADNDTYSSQLEELKKQQQELDKLTLTKSLLTSRTTLRL